MALTLNNFWGAETGGLEETVASDANSDISSSEVNSGTYSYHAVGSSTIDFDPFESVADAGGGYVFGFWSKQTAGSITIAIRGGGSPIIAIQISTALGQIRLWDANSSEVDAATADFSDGGYVEVYFTTTTAEVFIDGTSALSVTGEDFDNGSSPDLVRLAFSDATNWIDDIYFMSGATSASDRLGGCEVFAYRSSLASATPDYTKGSNGALNSGQWVDAQDLPFSESNVAIYSDTTARAGVAQTNDLGGAENAGGPSGDSNVDGDSNIVAMKGIWRMKRTGGSGAVHYGLMVSSNYSPTDTDRTADFDPTTSYVNYFDVREDRIPGASNNGFIGFEKDNKGQDFNCSDMLFQILHVPEPASQDQTVGPLTGISSAEAVGSATIKYDQTVSGTVGGIATTEAIGSAQLDLQIVATGIATAEAIGAAQLNLEIIASGIATAEAIGSAQLDLQIVATGIVSAEAIGSAQLDLQIVATGIATAEAIGAITVLAGNVNIVPTGIATAEAIGSGLEVILAGGADQDITGLTGIVSAEAIGSPRLDLEIVATGIATAEAFGSAQLDLQIIATGIATAEAFGLAQLDLTLLMTGVAGAEAFGSAQLDLTLLMTGVATAEVVGDLTVLAGNVDIIPTGIATAESVGSHVVTTAYDIIVTGIATAEAFGLAQLDLSLLSVGNIASVEAHGSATLTTGNVDIVPTGIATAEAIGDPEISQILAILGAGGIASAEAVGSHTLAPGNVDIVATGIATAEAIGSLSINMEIVATGIATSEAIGTPSINYGMVITGITSAEVVPDPAIVTGNVNVVPTGIPTAEVVPDQLVERDPSLLPTGIASEETFGAASLQAEYTIVANGIASAEAVGSHIATTGYIFVPDGVASAEAFGTALIGMEITGAGGIATAEVIGDINVVDSTNNIGPTGIPTSEQIGSHTILGGAQYQSSMFTRAFHGPYRGIFRDILGTRT